MSERDFGLGILKKDVDTIFWGSLNKLVGQRGLGIRGTANDKDIISRLIKAAVYVDDLPEDLSNPETMDEVKSVNYFANTLYDLFCEGAEIAESMMVGLEVKREYEKVMEEKGQAMSNYDKMIDAGHKASDF